MFVLPSKRALFLSAKIIVSILLLYLLLASIEVKAVGAALSEVPFGAIIIACSIFVVQTFILAIRWQILSSAIGWPLGYVRAIVFTFMGVFFNQTLPSSFGGDAIRIWRANKAGIPLAAAINGVLLERISGALSLTMLGAFAIWFVGEQLDSIALRLAFIALLPVSLLGVVFLMVLDRLPGLPNRITSFTQLSRFSADARAIFLNIPLSCTLLFLSLLSHFVAAIAAYVLATSLGIVTALWTFLALMYLVSVVLLFPLSFAGWGVREGAMVLILGFVSVAPEKALAISVLFGAIMVGASLPGALFWAFWRVDTNDPPSEAGNR